MVSNRIVLKRQHRYRLFSRFVAPLPVAWHRRVPHVIAAHRMVDVYERYMSGSVEAMEQMVDAVSAIEAVDAATQRLFWRTVRAGDTVTLVKHRELRRCLEHVARVLGWSIARIVQQYRATLAERHIPIRSFVRFITTIPQGKEK